MSCDRSVEDYGFVKQSVSAQSAGLVVVTSRQNFRIEIFVSDFSDSIITVTAKPDSPLGKASDVVLKLPDVPESDRFDVMSTASFAATVGIFDALMMGIMEETDYRTEQFAVIHPGGAVGKQLNS